MTLSEATAAATALAISLEQSIPLCTTRIEHVRVSAHAAAARHLANRLQEALQAASEPLPAHGTGIQQRAVLTSL